MSNDKKPGRMYVKDQIVDDGQQSVEAILGQEKDLAKIAAEEAVMNELVTIEVPATGNENEPPNFILNVNGRSQPVFRDMPITMRRCFVEVLARCKETKYVPQDADMANPLATNIPKGKTGFSYPFHVVEDKNPKGAEWLRAVRLEPA